MSICLHLLEYTAQPTSRNARACDIIKEEFGRDVTPQGVNFYTDAAIFLPPTGLPAILYGPGDASMAHQPEEYVAIDRISEAAHFYAAIIERYLVQ